MPSRFQVRTCVECRRKWQTRSLTARTCSPRCRAQLREREHGPTKGVPPRDYPPDLVAKIRELYESGMTQAEVQAAVGSGVKVQNVMRRYGIKARAAAPRDNRAERHPGWRGDAAGYQAMHLRVVAARGKPPRCEQCGKSGPGYYEWANLTGNYADVNDYRRMCKPCHRSYDDERRERTGAQPPQVGG